MATFSFAVHANLYKSKVLGCLVWGHGQARYYACPGEEDRAEGNNELFRRAVEEGGDLQDLIDHKLESGDGGYLSFTWPEEVEALSWDEVARKAAMMREIELIIPQARRPRCSRCGDGRDLHLVTALIWEPEVPGRVLVYCVDCRTELAHKLGVSLPLDEVDVETFVELYREGKTASAPDMAAEIVFGEALPDAVEGAKEILAAANAGGPHQ